MKKLSAVIMVLVMLVVASSCGKDAADVKGTYYQDNNITSTTEEKEISLGAINGNVYENEFIGIGFKPDSSWKFYDEQEIMKLNNLSMELAGDDFKEALKDASVIYDMFATDENGINNVNVNLEKVNSVALMGLNIEENFKNLTPLIDQGLENMGYVGITHEIGTVEVDGKTMDAVYTTAEINGVNMYQVLFQKKCNGYLASVTATVFTNDTLDEILNKFYWID